MTTNTDETFIRTSPPLTRYTVKLGATTPAPWEVLTAEMARELASDVFRAIEWGVLGDTWKEDAEGLRAYADAVDRNDPAADARPERRGVERAGEHHG